jgi:hypothetical protein
MTTLTASVELKQRAFNHVMQVVLEFKDDSPMMIVMQELGYNSIVDLEIMSEDEIMSLTYQPPQLVATPVAGSSGGETVIPSRKEIDMKSRKKLRNLIWWRNRLAAQRKPSVVHPEDYLNLTEEDFSLFVAQDVPAIVHSKGAGVAVTVTASSSDAIVTATDVETFAKGHKRSLDPYTSWNGEQRTWFSTKRNWVSTARTDGIDSIMHSDFAVPAEGTQARNLYASRNSWLYNVLQNKVKGGQALIIVRSCELDLDGRSAYLGIVDFYERKEKLQLITTQCKTKLANLKLTPNYPGGPKAFLQKFQHTYMDMENAQGKTVDDTEKIALLNAAIMGDHRFSNITSTFETLTLTGGPEVNWETYLLAIANHSNKLQAASGPTKQRNANKLEGESSGRGGGGRGGGKSQAGRGKGQESWRHDITKFVPHAEFKKLPEEEQKRRIAAREADKEKKRQANAVQQVPTPVVTVPHVQSTDTSVVSQPTIREIMSVTQSQATMSHLPPGQYTDANGRRFNINMARRIIRLSNHVDINSGEDLALCDRGSNNSMAGAAMRLLEQSEHPELVDVVGPSNQVIDDLRALPIGDYCAVAHASNGERILLVVPNTIGFGKGKSILCPAQMEAFGVDCCEKARKRGGKQKIVTPDGFVFKLRYQGALSYLPIEYPTDTDLLKLTRVYLTSPGEWNPDDENDDDDDIAWFDAKYDADDDALDDDTFYESRDEWFIPDDHLANPHYDLLTSTQIYALKCAKVCMNGLEKAKLPIDYESFRCFFGWKPIEVVRHTLACTTQFAKNVMRLPMRRHFKSRFPALRVRRLEEIYATDTFFANEVAHDGSTCVQLFCGRKSHFTAIYGMRTESQMPGALMDFIREFGAPKGLFSDNAKSETSKAVKDILRNYNIDAMQCEPHYQNQNPAERRIQEVKSLTNVVMDRTGAPGLLWLLCMTYCVYMLNHLAHANLNWRTPIEAAFGYTPDVSSLLCFTFYQPVLYLDHESSFPSSREKLGHFVGISQNVGDALTFMVLTSDTQQIIHRSVVRPADSATDPNVRLIPSGGEQTSSRFATNVSELIGPESLKLPSVDPMDLIGKTFLLERDVDGTIHRAEVISRVEYVDGETEQFLVKFGDGQREDIMTYDAIIEALDRQLQREADATNDDQYLIFTEVKGHRKIGNIWEVLMKWEDNTETWELLSSVKKDDPVTLAKYAKENNLLEVPGWKRLQAYVQQGKVNALYRQVQLNNLRNKSRVKFGVPIPSSYEQALEYDKKNGNNLWKEATESEMKQLFAYGTTRSLGKEAKVPVGYTKIRVHLVYDVKQDGRRKARLVAGGHLTGPNTDTYYSSVVSLRAMRILVFLSELNDLKLCAGDVGNAYLEAYTNEKVCFVAGREFENYAQHGHLLVIVKALYGLKTSGARFHEKFADSMRQLGYLPSKADHDVWMKDCNLHYDYVCTWVDDLLYAGKDPKSFFDSLETIGYKLKGVGTPTYHLGGDFIRVSEPESVLTWGATTYVKRMLTNYELIFGESVPKREIHAPLDPGDHPEIDESPLLEEAEIKIYWQMIGELQWAVSLGRMDIMGATVTMARFRPAPRQGHLDRLKRIYCFLRNYKKTAIKFNVEVPDYSRYVVERPQWGHIYHPCEEELPLVMPEPRGKPVMTTTFVDANLLHDLVTGRACTGIIHLFNKTPIDWFCKRQNTVETATYGSEFVAARIAVDQIVTLRYMLRMFGVPLSGTSWMFGDNLAVVNSATMPSGKLQKRHNILSYHRVREAQAAGIISFVHIDGKQNPADILTKHTSSREWYEVMKPLIYWRAKEDKLGSHRSEGSVSRSSLVTEL